MIKPYVIVFKTVAKVAVFVDAEDTDQAIELAYESINPAHAEFEDWEVDDVDYDTDR